MDDDTRYELMYRRPGADTHENITSVLDDILLKLADLERRLDELTNQ